MPNPCGALLGEVATKEHADETAVPGKTTGDVQISGKASDIPLLGKTIGEV